MPSSSSCAKDTKVRTSGAYAGVRGLNRARAGVEDLALAAVAVPPDVQRALKAAGASEDGNVSGCAPLRVTKVLPHTSQSPTAVVFGKLGDKPNSSDVAAKIAFVDPEEDPGSAIGISQLRAEREIMRLFPNEFIRQRLSPNFVAYYGTLLCPALRAAGDFSYRKGSAGAADKKELKEQIEALVENFQEDHGGRSPSCVAALLMESVPGFRSLGDVTDFGRRGIAPEVLVQLLAALHVNASAGLTHYDLHPGNVAVSTDTKAGSPQFHRRPVYYVFPGPNAREPRKGALVLRVDVTDRLVKLFDWDHGDAKTVRDVAGKRSERDYNFCEDLGRCDGRTRVDYDLVNTLRFVKPGLLLTQDELKSEESVRRALQELRDWWGPYGYSEEGYAVAGPRAGPKQVGARREAWRAFYNKHKRLWNPLVLLRRLADSDAATRSMVVDFVPPEDWTQRTFYSPEFSAADRRALRLGWKESSRAAPTRRGHAKKPKRGPPDPRPRRLSK